MVSTPSDWEETTVGDFAPFNYGESLPERLRNSSGNVTVFGSNGIVGRHDKPLSNGPGIIIGRKGTVGAVHFSPYPFWPIDTTFYILPDGRRDIRFTYYLLCALGLERMNSDSAVPGLNRNAAHARTIVVPPHPEQRAISAILGTLDDKIELNRQMNKTLEEMAQALFKNWFVDFEPFRDKGMEDSPLGPIPRGWEVAQIENLGDVICGKTPPTRDADNYEGHIPFITIPDMHDKVFVTQTGGYLTEKGAKTQLKKFLPYHAVCVSCIATPGLVALTSQPSHTNQQINSIVCNDSISPFWCYLAIINLRHEIITGGAGGSATLNLNKNEFSKLQAIKPSQAVMWKSHQIVEPFFSRILSNELENTKLADIRDSLLPKLLSGEIRVKDAEKFVGEMV